MINKLCRLCAKEKNGIEIYQEEGVKLKLSTKIMRCLQIWVHPADLLPKMVCVECCNKLNQSSEFFETSSEAQKILQRTLETEKGAVDDSLQNPNGIKEYVDCILLENSNQPEKPVTHSQSLAEREEQVKKTVVKQRKRRKNITEHKICKKPVTEVRRNEVHTSDSVDAKEEVEACYKHNESVQQRVRLEECYTWQCTDCPTVFATPQALKEHHSLAHDQTVRYQCIECAKVYYVYKKFTRHVRLHRNHGRYKCKECGKSFSSKQAVENHTVLHSGARPHSCSDCGKTFRQIGSLYSHRRIHQIDHNGFSCSDCGKILLTQQSLELHRKSHSGVRDYTCDICGKSFAVKQGLVYHMMSHSGERPHCCQLCGKRCKTIYLLNKHVATHSDVKANQCDVCGKQFRESSTLKLHIRIHTGAMPYRCEFCGRRFRFQGVYVIHRRQHTGERPYNCSKCKKDFTNWANYNKHVNCHHHNSTKSTTIPDQIYCSAKDKQNVRVNQEVDTNTLTDCSSTDDIKHQNIKQSNLTLYPSTHVVKFDRMISTLCPLQGNEKTTVSSAVTGNQYLSSDMYPHVSPSTLTGYSFYSAVNHDHINVSVFPGT